MNESMLEEVLEIMIFKIYWKAEDVGDDVRELLMHFAKETAQRVMNYCNIDDIPEGLYETVGAIATELIHCEGISLNDRGVEMALESIRLGDAKFDFSSASTLSQGIYEGIIKNYRLDLHRHRRCAI